MKKKIEFLERKINPTNPVELLEYLMMSTSGVELVNCVNAHAFNIAEKNEEFRSVLNSSEVIFCDGFGVK